MSNELLPVLAQQNDMRIVEVEGQPVVTARDLARALEYTSEYAVLKIYGRNKESFKELQRGGQSGIPLNYSEIKYDTGEVEIDTPGGRQKVRYFTKRGALKVCMKSNQPKAVMVQEMLIDLYEQVESGRLMPLDGSLLERFGQVQQQLWQLSGQLVALRRDLESVALPPGGRKSIPGKRACSTEVVEFIHRLFYSDPGQKTARIIEKAVDEAQKHGWRAGSKQTLYRVMKDVRTGYYLG